MRCSSYRVFARKRLFADRVLAATRFRQRLCGLLGRNALGAGEGLLLDPGGSVHTFGMAFPIDVVFLDRRRIIVGMRERLVPNRACIAPRRTRSTLELRAGACTAHGLRPGTRLSFEACDE